jgi:hypothetical protein
MDRLLDIFRPIAVRSLEQGGTQQRVEARPSPREFLPG